MGGLRDALVLFYSPVIVCNLESRILFEFWRDFQLN